MKERPILFGASMVRAILAGTKTQTRRVVRWPAGFSGSFEHLRAEAAEIVNSGQTAFGLRCPYAPGDRLWVRETFNDDRDETIYRADGGLPGDWCDGGSKWRPSIFMPRRLSRITLEVTGVRVERLQDISEADAVAEGTPCWVCGAHMDGLGEGDCHCFHKRATPADYGALWESINGPGSWDANPWVWVVEFAKATGENT